ncbi:MAG TPA: YdcF family protein [Flavobacterium sp.]|nr:YdcF family protein [Flavobacterium sp.]
MSHDTISVRFMVFLLNIFLWLRRILIIFLTIALIATVYVVGMAKFQPELKKADAAVILGAAVNTEALNQRTLAGLRLFEEGKTDLLVLSGGRGLGNRSSEAAVMEKIIKQKAKADLPEMIIEDTSHNTFDNIKNTREKIGKDKSIIIVSDEYHLGRGVLIAKMAGYKDVSWYAPDDPYYPRGELIYHYFRDIVATIVTIPRYFVN